MSFLARQAALFAVWGTGLLDDVVRLVMPVRPERTRDRYRGGMSDVEDLVARLEAEFADQIEVEVDPPDRKGRITVGVLYDRQRFDSEVFVVTEGAEFIQPLNYGDPLTLNECVEHIRQLLATVGKPRPKRSLVRRVLTWPSDR